MITMNKVYTALGARAVSSTDALERLHYTDEFRNTYTITKVSPDIIRIASNEYKVDSVVDISDCITIYEKRKGRKSISEVLAESISNLRDRFSRYNLREDSFVS